MELYKTHKTTTDDLIKTVMNVRSLNSVSVLC